MTVKTTFEPHEGEIWRFASNNGGYFLSPPSFNEYAYRSPTPLFDETFATQAGYTITSKDSRTTSNYMEVVKTGSLPINPYRYEKTEVGPVTGAIYGDIYGLKSDGSRFLMASTKKSGTSSDMSSWGFTDPGSLISPTPEMIASAVDECNSRLLSRIKSQKINLAQVWGERAQTFSLIASTATRIASAYKALRSGNIVSAGRNLAGIQPSRRVRRGFRERYVSEPLDATARAWLELQYGWLPLLSDIKGLVDEIDNGRPIYKDIRATATATRSDHGQYIVDATSYGHKAVVSWETRVTVKMTSFHQVSAALTGIATQLGLTNPLALGWELLPYSFVVDWLWPLGNYLSNLDATSGVSFSRGCRTVITERKYTVDWYGTGDQPISSPFQSTQSSSSGSARKVVKSLVIQRDAIDALPAPAIPPIKNPVSLGHALNALALLRLAFR